jgi:ribonuclease BN (tRNA processing enzyme)
MGLEVIGKMAARANVKTLVLSHLTQRIGTDDYTPWAEEVKKHFSGQVLVAKDLMEF